MSLYKRGTIWWSAIVYRGTRHVKSLEVTNKNDARILESKFRTEIVTGVAGLGRTITVTELTERLQTYLPPRMASTTFVSYSYSLKAICADKTLGGLRLSDVTTAVVNGFAESLLADGFAVATVNLYLRHLKHALNLAVEWNLLQKVPKFKQLPGENQREYVISRECEQQLLAKLSGIVRLLVLVLIDTGLRIDEACRLTWDDLEGNALHVRRGKSKYAQRRIPLTPRAVYTLEQLYADRSSDFVFTRNGEPLTPKWVWEQFKAAAAEAGLPDEAVVHSTRHTFCTRLGEAGASAFEIQRLAGHSDIKVSARYCHPENAQLDRAVERMAAV